MARKTFEQSVGEAYDIVTLTWTLARMCVESKVPFAEIAKVLRSAIQTEQEKHDAERAEARRLRRRAKKAATP